MDVAATLAYLPLSAMVAGLLIGLIIGRVLTGRWLWVLPGVLCAVSLVLIVKLATIQPGDEQSAFGPFIWLTGGLFPALFSVVMGTYVGRALHKRSTRT